MKRKIVWLVVTGWMVASLLLTSCAPAVVKEEAEKVASPKEKEEVVVPKAVAVPEKEANYIKWTGTKLDGTVVEKMIEKPRYGGVYIMAEDTQPTAFDDIPSRGTYPLNPTNDRILTRDWTRGPASTGEWINVGNMANVPERGVLVGLGAESWEIPDDTTLLLHIRQGIRFGLDPTSKMSRLVAGRQMTADDVVFSLRRSYTIGYPGASYPYLSDMKNVANSIYVSPTDKWTVVVKTQPKQQAQIMIAGVSNWVKIIAPETVGGVIARDKVVTDWRDVVGTGAFILKEYVGASALTYVRNPNYWQKDSLFPENQLPYLDGFKILIIPDLSTRMAGLRTGQIDDLMGLSGEDADSLRKTNPELQWGKYLRLTDNGLHMRNDTKPFDDIRVRRALAMATNRRELTDVYYGGDAELFTYPIMPVPDYIPLYKPLEEYSESVQELYEYNPDKAKQLLAEAGYPNGFKTEILVWRPQDVDLLSIVKEYWAKIGVDLKIDVRDYTVWVAMARDALPERKTYKQMVLASVVSSGFLFDLPSERMFPAMQNYSFIYEPLHKVVRDRITENQFDTAKRNAALTAPMGEGLPSWRDYAAEQSWFIPLPIPYSYFFWQPWLKNYYGASGSFHFSNLDHTKYVWIDQELKKAMGR